MDKALALSFANWAKTGSLVIAVGLCIGGCPRPDDLFEPNDTTATATPLVPGKPITARVAQFTNDVFTIEVSAGQTVLFRIESLDFEVCPLFSATGPDETILYKEPLTSCRDFEPIEPEVQIDGASLTIFPNKAFELRIPAEKEGRYFLTIFEGGHADNVFSYSWEYRVTATFE